MTFMPQRVTIEPSYAEEEVDEYVLCLEDVDSVPDTVPPRQWLVRVPPACHS
jgi:hypothetical protein